MNSNFDWKVIDSYFLSNKKYITNHHIFSFDTFLTNKIPYIVQTLNPFTVVKTDDNDKKKHEINVYMGGRNGDGIEIARPCIIENGKEVILYPNVARLKEYSYTSDIKIDVLIEYKTFSDDGSVVSSDEVLYKKIHIGNIPIMLQSKGCVLNNLAEEDLYFLGECPYDQGGYFIVDGKEKVIVSQERVATNKLFLNHISPTDVARHNFTHMGLIRNTSKTNSLFPKTVTMLVFDDKVNADGNSRHKAIVLTVPNIDNEYIPLFVLFRALGVESDMDIIRHIFLSDANEISSDYLTFIRKSVHEGSIVTTQKDALAYIARYTRYKHVNFVRQILSNDLFPNVGVSYKSKALYLGYLTLKIIKFYLGEITQTNRDSYMYKRVDVSGVLIGQVFRDGYNQLRNNIKNRIDKEYIYGSWKDMSEFQVIVNGSLNTIFNKNLISTLMRRSFKGKWGTRESEGIVQDLNRLSYLGYVSHMRRVNTPMDRSLKLVTPHRADASQWGFMCPIESPDGANIGLLKHMAVTCEISAENSEDDLFNILKSFLDLTELSTLYPTHVKKKTKVLLNNNWIGVHSEPVELVKALRVLKQSGVIDKNTSISWDIIDNEIEIYNDSGRCVRPVYVIHENKKAQSNIVSIFKDKNISDYWKEILPHNVQQPKELIWKEFYKKIQNTTSSVEFIDSTETSRSYIAMNRDDLDKKSSFIHTYDYLEIHPSLVLSLYTNVIPLAHHNQAPRNIFSGQQGKQALGVYSSAFNNRIDTASYILHYPQKGLLTTKYAKYAHVDKLPNGENVIVAIATYTGYNQEDSIIFNKSSLQRGMFNSSIFKSHIESEETNEVTGEHIKFANPLEMLKDGKNVNVKLGKWDKIDEKGIPILNKYIEEDDVYVGKVKTEYIMKDDDETSERVRNPEDEILIQYSDKSSVASATEGGMIDKAFLFEKHDKKKLKIRFRKTREPTLGDKFASRHGQKGVIGMVLPQEDMPFTRDGIVPDIIINPHAIPSRMTIGHLIESVLSKYACYSGNIIDGTVFENNDNKTYFEELGKKGYQKHGNELLYNGYSGDQIKADIFFGPTFYFRLKHMVKDKINYRGGKVDPSKNPVTGTTRQPTHGRANKGGLRIGEMETNALLGHGIGSFMKESMMERSDEYTYALDVQNGTIASHISKKDDDSVCEREPEITNVSTPFSFKLLTQEVAALGIKASLRVNKTITQKENENIEDDLYYIDEDLEED